MTPVETGTAIKLALEAGSKAVDLLRYPKPDGDAVRREVMVMYDLLFSAQRGLNELDDEIRSLKRKLEDREALTALDADMVFIQDGGFYTKKSESGEIPYCPVCWKNNTKTIPLNRVETAGMYQCGLDNTTYKTQAYRSHRQNARDSFNQAIRRSGGSNGWME